MQSRKVGEASATCIAARNMFRRSPSNCPTRHLAAAEAGLRIETQI
jgi:hypothetical protein